LPICTTTNFPQEFPFEYTSNLSNQMLILVNESLGESGSGTGSANLYYSGTSKCWPSNVLSLTSKF